MSSIRRLKSTGVIYSFLFDYIILQLKESCVTGALQKLSHFSELLSWYFILGCRSYMRIGGVSR